MSRILNYQFNPEPDPRDFKYKAIVHPVSLPRNVSLINLMPPIHDQGNLGSCVENGLMAIQQKEEKVMCSRLYAYYKARTDKSHDTGLYVSAACKSLLKTGSCLEKTWPYDIAKFTTKPPAACDKEAILFKPKEYQAVPKTANAIKSAIFNGHPVAFGILLKESFESDAVAKSGIYSPKPSEAVIGGHCMVIVGYNDLDGYYTIRNSWGPQWGSNGHVKIKYEVIHSADASDFFTLIY